MIKYIFALLLCSAIIIPSLAISTTTITGTAGSISYSHCVSMEVAKDGLNWPVFGANNSGSPYTYDGSQASVLTLGKTNFERNVVIDQTNSNAYTAGTTVSGSNMINAEDTAGMMNIQPNEPDNMCDTEGFLDGSGSATGSYPYSESFEGRTGAIIHGGGAYQSEVGLLDGNVHLSGAADIESKGYLYQNKIVTSKKGFDKNSTTLNLDTSETMNYIASTMVGDGTYNEVHKSVVSDYTSIEDAFDDVIEIEAVNQSVTSISEGRIDDEVLNSTIEVNETMELPNQTHGESPGLEEISGQSIIRD